MLKQKSKSAIASIIRAEDWKQGKVTLTRTYIPYYPRTKNYIRTLALSDQSRIKTYVPYYPFIMI